MADENIVWTASPSQILNLPLFIVCLALVGGMMGLVVNGLLELSQFFLYSLLPLLFALWFWLVISHTRYELTNERLITRSGVLNKTVDELELYRVRDYQLEQPLLIRLFFLGNIRLETTDKSHPILMLRAIANGEDVRNKIRAVVEVCRVARGVRQIDYA